MAAEPFECAICTSPIEDPVIGGGCTHHFCRPCLTQWIQHKPNCPTCRAPVWCVLRDPEFATLAGVPVASSVDTDATPVADHSGGRGRTRVQRVAVGAPAGLTIGGVRGCIVTRVVRGNGGFCAGVKVGDTILAVNDTPVHDHRRCVELIEQRCRVGDCTLLVENSERAFLRRIQRRISRNS